MIPTDCKITDFSLCLCIQTCTFTGTILANAQACRNTGSLSNQGESIVDKATTYIIPTYNITCDGVVIGWEFCYHNVPSVTFYPSVWRWRENNLYTLVHTSRVNYNVPQHSSGLNVSCTKHHLPADEQYSVHTNDIIGFYSSNSLILTTGDIDDYVVYSVVGNQSIVDPNGSGVNQQHFHAAIVAIISE